MKTTTTLVDSLGQELSSVLCKAKKIALETCATTIVNVSDRPHLHCAPRGDKLTRKHAKLNRKKLGEWMSTTHPVQCDELLEKNPHLKNIITETQKQRDPAGLNAPDTDKQAIYKQAKRMLNQQINQIDREHASHAKQLARLSARRLADQKIKLGNRIALGTMGRRNKVLLKVLSTADATLTTEPSRILDTITQYYTCKMAAPSATPHPPS